MDVFAYTDLSSDSMGETEKSAQDVRAEISALGEHFPGNSYSLILKNCNHFSVSCAPRTTLGRVAR